MSDRIEKSIELSAPTERVWRALTDYTEFGEWFRVKLDGPFRTGEVSTGRIAYPGYEHLKWEATVTAMDEPHLFAFTWHPYAVEPDMDYSKETPTLVEFKLETAGESTKLTVVESGFNGLPPHRMQEAMRMNERGWAEQIKNIKAHVE
ncbi:SRPBCC family protein [Phyllobacterium endophyticum]|uniref:SRPBCC family protein n=1 Tax=Phyllobacterium endophyticum TaxID=1149773 RepID=UPI0011CA6281|nr:SRPBCC family protein [Phyllobacterium endophyticum]TXR49985.1 vanillate O-demethylase oxidoreductase VanB [Phyllobacterium endophyticum]